jgi:hypothetical protein
MTTEPSLFTIFYSWQSDLPDETNRRAIRIALRNASSAIEVDNPNIRIEIDEATRGVSGSPDIPGTIMDKINNCSAFFCDITTINATAEDGQRRCPNPNVVFELGYAVARIGWRRIVMLFNEEFGIFPDDMPFDFDRHRGSPYKLAAQVATSKEKNSRLTSLIIDAITAIIKACPKKPFDLMHATPEEIKRQRDISNIKWVMSTIHMPTVDDMIDNLPETLSSRMFHFWESFNGVISNRLFHIYDVDLFMAFRNVHSAWQSCVSHGEYYFFAGNSNVLCFNNQGNMPLDARREKEWNDILSARDALRISLDKLLEMIRARFLEIDIDEMNEIAWTEYVEFHRDMDKKLER